jgi:SNF2 family DNA or RNA helicase
LDYAVHGELSVDGTHVIVMAAGDLGTAAGRLKRLTPAFRVTEPRGGLQAPVTWPLLVQLGAELGTAWVPGPRLKAWMLAAVIARTDFPELIAKTSADAPPPRDYQRDGARIIAATGRAMIFDDPGTGKTLTTLLGLAELRARGRLPVAGPIVVVCPNSVMDAWVATAHRWTDLRAVAWRGSVDRRAKLAGTADMYVVGYAVARNDAGDRAGALRRLGPAAVVIDECHQIKNPQAAQSKAVRALCKGALSVIALSGTPITHSSADLFPTLNAMEHGAWPSRERYVERYIDAVPGDYSDELLGLNKLREPEFRRVFTGQHRRLAKEDVLTELPPKVYSVREVELPAAARKAYDSMRTDMLAELPDGQELPAMSVLAQLQRLLQLACASADVSTTTEIVDGEHGPEEKIHTHVELKDPSWKVDALMDVLAERPGKQTLAFAPSADLVRIAGARAAAGGYRVGYVIGGQPAKDRTATIAAFQAGQLDVLCLTTGAGGTGITLTAASTVVFLQRPWSFVDASQAEDRAHRIGSEIHKSVEIIDIVAKDSIDSEVREILRGKAGALAELLEDRRIVEQCLGGRDNYTEEDQTSG